MFDFFFSRRDDQLFNQAREYVMRSASALREGAYTAEEDEQILDCRFGERAARLMAKSCADREQRYYCNEIREAFLLMRALIESGQHYRWALKEAPDVIGPLAEFVPPVA